MRKIRQYVWMALMSACLTVAPAISAQTRSTTGSSAHRTTGTDTGTRTSRTSTTARQTTSSQPKMSNTKPTSQKALNSTSTARPASSTPRPGGSNVRPGGNTGNNSSASRPSSSTPRPGGGSNVRPGGGSNVRPGGGSNVRPGGGSNVRPGGLHGHPGGNSAPRPGAGGRPATPPPPRPAYHPPVTYRWERPLPPPPPRYNYVRVGVPSIGSILGLTFGSLIDYGVASLINSGYNVYSTYGGNTIYLNNVSQYGVTWPEATIFYTNGGLSGARFQYGSYSPTDYRFMTAYSQLCGIYGEPVSYTNVNGYPVATWWGGNNTGYITLQYGPGVNSTGATMYYTDLIYGL